MIKIVLIGAGNLAFHFQKIFATSAGVDLIQWYSRSLEKIKPFESQIPITNRITDLRPADVYLIAVSDDAIAEISAKIKTRALVVHCSGAVAVDQLLCNTKGVFYPLQSFSKEHPSNFGDLTILIEAENKNNLETLYKLSNAIGSKSLEMDSKNRAFVHLTAVILNNFGNHLFDIGQGIAKANGIPFDIFHPLIELTYQKVKKVGAKNAQTGPAIRKDKETIKKNLDLITDQEIKKLYLLLTESIQRRHE